MAAAATLNKQILWMKYLDTTSIKKGQTHISALTNSDIAAMTIVDNQSNAYSTPQQLQRKQTANAAPATQTAQTAKANKQTAAAVIHKNQRREQAAHRCSAQNLPNSPPRNVYLEFCSCQTKSSEMDCLRQDLPNSEV